MMGGGALYALVYIIIVLTISVRIFGRKNFK
jgi:hypothetical protein